MVVDATVQRTIDDARIDVAVDELRRQHGESQVPDLASELAAQLAGIGVPQGAGSSESSAMSTATMLVLWNRDTGEPSNVTFDSLAAHLKVRFDPEHPTRAGEKVYQTTPMEPKTRGVLLCPLHKDHPDRAQADALGMATVFCKADHIPTELDVEIHCKNRHPAYYRRLEFEKKRIAERALLLATERQTVIMEALLAQGFSRDKVTAAVK